MGVHEIDLAFTALIDKSAELLDMARPQTNFNALKPVKITPRVEIDFNLISSVESGNKAHYTNEYKALFSELKRFEPSVLTFSSLEPGQGVTFTSTNIAKLWAREEGKKVLILEFCNGFSGCKYPITVDEESETITNPQKIEEYISYVTDDNLYLLSLRSSNIKSDIDEFWNRLASSFDLIIVDASPSGFNIMTDQVISRSTGIILVSSQKPDPVNIKVFEKNTKELGGRFLGVVLNAID